MSLFQSGITCPACWQHGRNPRHTHAMECERPAIRHRSAVAVPARGQRRNPYTPPRHAGSH
eukprot:847387-Prorocentrum_lima.AAC.1